LGGPKAVRIGDRLVGPGLPCFVIAEAGVNHNGDVDLARELVRAAANSGADAVKFQSFRAENLVAAGAPKAKYQLETTDAAESQFAMIKRLELSAAAHRELVAQCREAGIVFLSSPFDEEMVDLLAELDVHAFKIPSGEITNLRYLRHVARKYKPMLLSTGMASLEEVKAALSAIEGAGDPGVVLLHCVSNYPADPANVNLHAMTTMAQAFQRAVGYSDHVLGNEVAFAAVALGACVVEKHFTLDRSLPGPDHRASAEPAELAALVRGIRAVEASLGDGCKRPAPSEADTAAVARKSLFAARDIPAGAMIEADALVAKRPGTGMAASMLDAIVGRRTRRAVAKDAMLTPEDLA
jgi:N-acetylneuraminate synthase/N,N'-diacetyllegionaminate synthase